MHERLQEALKHTQLSLDEVLGIFGVEHKDWRQYLVGNQQELYSITPGMVDEILSLHYHDKPRRIGRLYHISPDIAAAVLDGRVSGSDYTERDHTLAMIRQDLLRGGLSRHVIADKWGVSQSRVSQIAMKLGLGTPRVKRRLMTPEEVQAIIDDSKSASAQELAKKYNRSLPTIYKVLNNARIH
jgi:predicted transcriptional regulator